jgi:salicylate hydroxylase
VPRINRLRQRGAFNQFAYHARGPIRIGRDIVLSLKPPQSLAAADLRLDLSKATDSH